MSQFFEKGVGPVLAKLPRGLRNSLDFLTGKMYTATSVARCYQPLLTTQRIGKTEFKLWIHGRHQGAQKEYKALESKGEVYEPLMTACMTRMIDQLPDSVFMDIGAFVGYFACYVAKYLNDSRPVYAIESNPDYCRTIERSIAENGFKNLTLFDTALSDRAELLSVYRETVLAENVAEAKKIQTVALDQLCREKGIRPTILKIDVHGAEGKVLAGAKAILKETVDVVLFELHPDDFLEKYSPGYNRDDILKIIRECGFETYLMGGFRFKRSPERTKFLKTGKMSYLPLTPATQRFLLYDRGADLFILGMKNHKISDMDFLEEWAG